MEWLWEIVLCGWGDVGVGGMRCECGVVGQVEKTLVVIGRPHH